MQNVCVSCSAPFEISDADLQFYDQVSPTFNGQKHLIPPPTHCPVCRQRRRMIWRNERALYRRTCDKTGKKIVSCLPKDSPYTVYSQEAFWSDDWDPRDYGRDVDFNRPFFEQFNELIRAVPQIALLNTQTENSEFCHRIYDGRNNYLSTIALYNPENLLYTYYTMTCKDSVDTAYNQYCELCYETVDAERCYNCRYALRVRNCKDCFFCEDCIGCTDCFGCKNLHQKQFCIFNEQKSAQEYRDFMQTCNVDSFSFIKEQQKRCHDFCLQYPNRSNMMVNTENVTGGNVYHCKDSTELYDWYESEHMVHCALGEKSHHCMDCYGMGCGEFCCDSITVQYTNHALFCATAINTSNLLYCYECYADTANCFGCSSMKKGKYCILNKQYNQEEYETLAGKLIEHMQNTSEWGEFLPSEYSPMAYNESVAQDHYPLTKEEAQAQGYRWQDVDDAIEGVTKTIPADQLPDALSAIPDDIINWAIECPVTKRPFKVIKQELEFYRTHQIPIPRLHPEERHRLRIARRNPRQLWPRQCAKCQQEIQSTYAPERPEIVYCESCYLETVY